MESKWRDKCIKCDTTVEQIMKNQRPENMHIQITEVNETQALASSIFVSTLERNRSFHFSRFAQKVSKLVATGLRNRRLKAPLAPKRAQKKRLKGVLKQAVEKMRNMMKSRPPNECPKTDLFVLFWDLGVKVAQGGPKDSFWDPRGPNLIQKGAKMDARSMIYLMF